MEGTPGQIAEKRLRALIKSIKNSPDHYDEQTMFNEFMDINYPLTVRPNSWTIGEFNWLCELLEKERPRLETQKLSEAPKPI